MGGVVRVRYQKISSSLIKYMYLFFSFSLLIVVSKRSYRKNTPRFYVTRICIYTISCSVFIRVCPTILIALYICIKEEITLYTHIYSIAIEYYIPHRPNRRSFSFVVIEISKQYVTYAIYGIPI